MFWVSRVIPASAVQSRRRPAGTAKQTAGLVMCPRGYGRQFDSPMSPKFLTRLSGPTIPMPRGALGHAAIRKRQWFYQIGTYLVKT